MKTSTPALSLLSLIIACFIQAGAGEIQEAVLLGNVQTVKKLLQDTPSLANSMVIPGMTLLTFAASSDRNLEIARLLVEKGVNLDGVAPFDETPLRAAISGSAFKVVQMLTQAGADVSLKDNDDETPLHYAASNGETRSVPLLLSKGANINAADDAGYSPLMNATERGHPGAKIDQQDIRGESALHLAASQNREKELALLLERGADANLARKDGKTPLDSAVQFG